MSDTAFQAYEPMPRPGEPSTDVIATRAIARRIRLWPGVFIVALQWTAVTILRQVFAGTPTEFYAIMGGPVVGTAFFLGWWVFFSRLRWVDRVGFPALFALLGVAAGFLGDSSVGFLLLIYGLPAGVTAWILWLVASYPAGWPMRRVGLGLVLLLVSGYFALIRLDGVSGDFSTATSWRWQPTLEEKFLAERTPPAPAASPASVKALVLQAGDWPCFRGPKCDNRVTGVTIPTDWDRHAPKLLWRHKVGPGWGSFAVVGNLLFTQEQWDKNEAVVCYDGDTGKTVWYHEYSARFTEAVAGPGPRATPTFHEGKLYTMGAAGTLCCLDAASGSEIWSVDIVADTEAKVPQWGFASSPLIAHGLVMVFAGGPEKSVVAYDAASGKLKWTAGNAKMSYASLQLATVDGVEQALLAAGEGLTAFRPQDGAILWEHAWVLEGGARRTQPAAVGPADFLLGTPFGTGTKRLYVAKSADGTWKTRELWTTRKFSPYFNDFVVHSDHLYGFNGTFFTCVEIATGKATWKERGYGSGQVLLLADQNLLLIVSEKGEAALVEARPDEHRELGRFQAIEGKTWNHPVLAHGRLFVRNGEEAACYQLQE